jgi:ubiquinone/menaquinone biosynthesis C-methylase UbiE
MKHVNYDPIASSYNDRYRVNRLPAVERALLEFVQNKQPRRILEVGCGTGRWLNSIGSLVDGVFGLDLSYGMLTQARKGNPNLNVVQGRAGVLPFVNQSFDMVFCVNALHHFNDPQGFITETGFLLKNGGGLAIIGQTPKDRRNRWYIYDYFEGTYETDLRRFHTWETIMGWMERNGYNEIQWSPIETIIDHKYGRDVLKDPFLQKNAVSQLALLSNRAYQKGLIQIQKAIQLAETHGETLTFQTKLRLDMLTGTMKPPG